MCYTILTSRFILALLVFASIHMSYVHASREYPRYGSDWAAENGVVEGASVWNKSPLITNPRIRLEDGALCKSYVCYFGIDSTQGNTGKELYINILPKIPTKILIQILGFCVDNKEDAASIEMLKLTLAELKKRDLIESTQCTPAK